jgi:voltage-dependent anion channel protein 2
MGKAVTTFKDLGKACSDLLSKEFDVGKTTVEVKSPTASGVTFTPKAEKKDDSSISGKLTAKYSFFPWMTGEGVFNTSGAIESTFEAKDLYKGLVCSAKCERGKGAKGMLTKADMIAEYKSDMLSCKASYDLYKTDLLASASTAYGALTCGVDTAFSTSKMALSKYAASCEFVQPDFIVMSKWESKDKKLSCSYFHKVSPDMQLGIAVAKPLPKPDVTVELGTAYKLDKDTTVKVKVNSDGNLFASFQQKLNAITKMTLAAQVDCNNFADNKHKFGMGLVITP